MSVSRAGDHWFSFKDACVAVSEIVPLSSASESKELIIFLHGRFGHAAMWAPLVQVLSAQFRCISIDFPGFGHSMCLREGGFSLLEHASLVNELLHQWVPAGRKAVIVGHDMGGGVAQFCALKSPQKVASLVLINSACLMRKLGKINPGFQGYLAKRVLKRLIAQSNCLETDDQMELLYPWSNHRSRRSMTRALKALEESWPLYYEQLGWKKAMTQMNLPVLLLWGGKERIHPSEIGMELMKQVPEAYFFVHDSSGHWPNLECSDWILSKMKEFMFRVGFGFSIKIGQKFLLK